jgi:hypothetical protein
LLRYDEARTFISTVYYFLQGILKRFLLGEKEAPVHPPSLFEIKNEPVQLRYRVPTLTVDCINPSSNLGIEETPAVYQRDLFFCLQGPTASVLIIVFELVHPEIVWYQLVLENLIVTFLKGLRCIIVSLTLAVTFVLFVVVGRRDHSQEVAEITEMKKGGLRRFGTKRRPFSIKSHSHRRGYSSPAVL